MRILAELLLLNLEPLRNADVEQYALMDHILLTDRIELYQQSLKQRDRVARDRLRDLAANVFGLGYRAKYTLPLLAAVDSVDSFIVLLDVMFMVVTFFLALLSVLLIYSLMMSVSRDPDTSNRMSTKRPTSTAC